MKRKFGLMGRGPRRALWPLLAAVAALSAACGPKAPPLTQMTPEELWLKGVDAYNARHWDKAIRFFGQYITVGGTDPRVHQARYYTGEAYFNDHQYVSAAGEFTRLAGDLGRTDLADDARFMACRAYEELSPDPQLDQEYTRAAIDHCQALINYFPDSSHADQAREIVANMQEKLAAKVYEGGEWYFHRRAYDSAVIYFDVVVKQYPQTEHAPKALARLIRIYDILDYQDEHDQAVQQLRSQYPDSPEARALGRTAA